MIASITMFQYRLPLRTPLPLGAHTIEARDGVLVRICDAAGHQGWGDVAPLPGFSTESMAYARRELEATAPQLVGGPVDAALDHLAHANTASSVRCGLEMALLETKAREAGTTLPHVLSPKVRPSVSFNALLTDDDRALENEVTALRRTGYPAVKVKVGRRPVAEDVARVQALARQLPGVALRLDANRAWSFADAYRFAEGICDVSVDYVEEPLVDAAELPRLAAETGMPVALDETIQEGAAPRDHSYATAVILKPTLVGGLRAAQRLAAEAERVACQPVLSASFESGAGLRGLIALAAGLGTKDVPVGLDTYHRLAADVWLPRLPLEGPRVAVADVYAASETLNADVVQDEVSFTA
jgi:O-succinylbenzoate synthase